VGVALLFITRDLPSAIAFPSGLIALLIILASVATELFAYLQQGRGLSTIRLGGVEIELEKSEVTRVEEDISSLRAQLEASETEFATRVFSASEKEELKRAVVERLHQYEVKSVLLELQEKIRVEQQQRLTSLNLAGFYDGVISSLEREISNLGRRANLNLVMGTIVTSVGLFILGYFVFYAVHPALTDKIDTAIYFGTRLTLVVFIEIFAYFFLKLYRYSLFEIKYFQNEVTNARFKIVALEACLREGSKQIVEKLCFELVKTERNFILKKGETTLSLRREEIEQMNDSTVTKLIERVLGARESSETSRK